MSDLTPERIRELLRDEYPSYTHGGCRRRSTLTERELWRFESNNGPVVAVLATLAEARDTIEKRDAELAGLHKRFGHMHEAGRSGKHIDECNRCGLDLRNRVHAKENYR